MLSHAVLCAAPCLQLRPQLAVSVLEKTKLLKWLLARLKVKGSDGNKQYASELLAILMQVREGGGGRGGEGRGGEGREGGGVVLYSYRHAGQIAARGVRWRLLTDAVMHISCIVYRCPAAQALLLVAFARCTVHSIGLPPSQPSAVTLCCCCRCRCRCWGSFPLPRAMSPTRRCWARATALMFCWCAWLASSPRSLQMNWSMRQWRTCLMRCAHACCCQLTGALRQGASWVQLVSAKENMDVHTDGCGMVSVMMYVAKYAQNLFLGPNMS